MENVGKKILLIDDDSVLVNLYHTSFEASGLNCSIATNGTQGLEKAGAEKPDLILLDIMMPDLDGFEVLKRFKQNPFTANIPVWMLTNLPEQLNKETADNLGATDYLVKSSMTPKQIIEKIKTFFGLQT